MRRSSALTGIIGLVLISFGLLDYFIASGFKFFVFINIVLGAFALILWAVSSREAVGSMVGHGPPVTAPTRWSIRSRLSACWSP